jgi:UDP-N-acetylmuramate dehydrogenase
MNMAEPRAFTSAGAALRGMLRTNESMARHVSWRAGGRAAVVYAPADLDDLAVFLRSRPAEQPVCFVGLGSNLLVRDGGFEGSVVLLHSSHASIAIDGDRVVAHAGAASPKVARLAATHGLEGAEFLAGVPGCVGGALAMNAGCYGSETWEFVAGVRTIDRAGLVRERPASDFSATYRHVELKGAVIGEDEWFVEGTFRFRPGNGATARERIRALLARRIATQPLGLPNAGSVFRNPPGDHAARLIEASGLKGFAIGGARISERHANFIVNPGGQARASDIENLIAHARRVVAERFGIDLVPEVRIIGSKRNGKETT